MDSVWRILWRRSYPSFQLLSQNSLTDCCLKHFIWFRLTKIKSIHQSWTVQYDSCLCCFGCQISSAVSLFCIFHLPWVELTRCDVIRIFRTAVVYCFIIRHRYREHQNNVKAWGRGTHTYVSALVHIGSDNGFSPVISINIGLLWHCTIRNKFRLNWDKKDKSYISGTFICKYRLQSGGHFGTASAC